LDIFQKLSPSARVVCAGLRRLVRPLAPPPPAEAALDADVLAFLSRTGLGGAYHRVLEQEGRDPSSAFSQKVRSLYFGIYAANMVRFDEFLRLERLLKTQGIPVVPLKGMVMAALVHRDIGMRPMVDVDVLLPPNHLTDAADALREMGYRSEAMPLDDFAGDFGRHIPAFYHPRKRVAVEVHRAVDYHFSFLGGPPDVLGRARHDTIDGRTVLVPAWEDVLHQWGVHTVYMDAWLGKLRDLFDLAVLVETKGDLLDWDLVASRGIYGLRPLWFGLTAAADIFDSPKCRAAAKRIAPRARLAFPTRGAARRLLLRNLLHGAPRLPLSMISALSFAIHCPELVPGFLGEFVRVFLFPGAPTLRRHYPRLARLPALVPAALRPFHVGAVMLHRLAGKLRAQS